MHLRGVLFLEGFLKGEAADRRNILWFLEAPHRRSAEGGAIFKVTFFHSEKCPAPGQVQTLVQTRHLLRLLPVLSAHSRWVEFPLRKPSHIHGFF